MNRTLKSLLGAAVLVALGTTAATAQTGSLQGRRTIFNDGGNTPADLNRITLTAPAANVLLNDYNLILPPNTGNADDILFTPDGTGTLEFTSGDALFWRLKGNNTTFVDGVNNLLGTLTADPLNIITNNTTRIRVLSTGEVGIGTSTPGFLLDVAGNTNVRGETYLRQNAYFYEAGTGFLGGNIGASEPGGAVGEETKLSLYGGRGRGGIILYTNVNNTRTEVMRLTGGLAPGIGGRVSIMAGASPNQLVSIGGGAGGNLTIDDNGNLVTAGNITINGAGINDIGVAASTNNITGTNTLLGATDINVTGTFATNIGSIAGGNVTIGVNDGTTDLTLNGIRDVAPTGADDILWITDVTNRVRRTSFGGMVEQGITFDAEGGSTKIRLGGLTNLSNPLAANRFVNLDVNTLTFTAAGGTENMLQMNGTTGNFLVRAFGPTGEGELQASRSLRAVTDQAGWPTLRIQNTAPGAASSMEWQDNTGSGHMQVGIQSGGGPNFLNSNSGRNFDIQTSGIVEATFSNTGLNIVNNLTVGDNATIGDNDADQHLIQGVTNINTTATNAATTIGATSNAGAVSIASGATITSNSTGLTSITGGTGVDVTATTGDVDVVSSAGNVNVTSTGTGNDVNILGSDGEVSIRALASTPGPNGDVELYADSDFNVLVRDDIDLFATSNDGAVTSNIVLEATNSANATNAGISITSGGSYSNRAGTTYTLIAPTANLNTNTAAASTTNIGNTTNGIVNIAGSGDNGVTITGTQAAAGDNTIVMDVGNVNSNLVLNNIAVVNPIEDLLWINAANQVRRTSFTGTANEGLMFENSSYRLGHSTEGGNAIVSDRYVRIDAGTAGPSMLSFTWGDGFPGYDNMLTLSSTGAVGINTTSTGTTAIGSPTAGTISLESASTITGTAGTTMQLNMIDLDVNATATIDLNAGNTLTTLSTNLTSITGGTGVDVTATVGDIDVLSSAGQVNITAVGAGNDVNISATDDVDVFADSDFNVNAKDDIDLIVESAVGATAADIVMSATNTATATNATISMTSGGSISSSSGTTTTQTVGTTYSLSAPTANINTATASTTNIGNTTNGIVNVRGYGNNGLTITGAQNAAGDNTVVIDPGTTTSDLVLNNIATTTAPVNMLSLDGSNQVRQKTLTGMADEGLQYDGTDGEFKLGHLTDGSNAITSNRYVRVSNSGGTRTLAYTWLDGGSVSRNLLTLASNGTVGINTTGGGTTNIGSGTAGGVNIDGAGIDIEAQGATDIQLRATGNHIRQDAAIIDISGTTQIDLNTDVTGTVNVGQNGNTTNMLSSTIEIGKGAYTTAVNIGTSANATNTILGVTNINRAGSAITQAGASGNTVEIIGSTNNFGTDNFATTNTIGRTSTATNNILGTTNINNVAGGNNTVIGNTGAGATTVTINAGTTGNIVLGGVDTDTEPDYMLSLDASPTGNVRVKQLTTMASEGLQYDAADGTFKLGHSTTGTGAQITSSRFVNIGAGGTLTFRDATNTKQLVLNNNGNVEINSSSTGTTTIGSSTAGAISATANANISLEAVGTGDISFTATGDDVSTSAANISLQGSSTVDMDAPAITINDAGSGTTQIGNASAGSVTINAGGVSNDVSISANDIISMASGTITGTSTNGNVTFSATGSGNFSATGATAATMTASANALTLNANGASGSVVVNATGAGNDVDINANDLVTIDATTITNTATTFNVASTTTNLNTGIASTTNIGNTTNGVVNVRGRGNNGVTITGAQTSAGDNTIVIDPGATTSDLILNNISTLSPVLDLLWITTNNEVRRAPFSATADEGVQFQTSSYRLGVAASTDATPWNDKSFLEDRYVNLNTSSLFFTTNNVNSSLLELNGDAANGSVSMFSYGTGNITLQAGSNDVVLNANSSTGMVQLNATNAAGDIDINAGDQMTIDAADVLIGSTDDMTLGATDVLSLAGNSASFQTSGGDLTITVPGSGDDLILNGITTDNTVLTYLGVTASNEVREVSLNATAWLLGGNTLTSAQTIGSNNAFDVAIETNGTTRLTFTSGGAITQSGAGQVTFTGNVDATSGLDVTNADLTVGGSNFTVDDATGNITNIGTTTFGDGVNTDNSTFNLGTLGLLRVNNDPAINDLLLQETGITRSGNISIDPGASSSVTTNGSLSVAGGASLGDGSGTDNVTINTGAGTFTATGQTNINTTGSNSTTIGSTTSGTGVVSIASQNSMFLRTSGSGTVYIQDTDNGDVVIGNATANVINVVGTVNMNTTNSGGATNIGTGTNASNVTLGNTGNDVIMGAPATFQRSMNVKFNTINANTTLDESYHVVVCTNAALITVALPAAATAGAGRVYVIKSAGAGDVVIDPDGVETVEGLGSFTITGGGNLTRTIVSSGATWYVIGN